MADETREFYHTSPVYWSESDLAKWLNCRGLPACITRAFEDHLVNGLVAVDLKLEDLHLMGIHNGLHRRRVMLELRHLYGPEGWEGTLQSLNPQQLLDPATAPPPLPPAPPAPKTALPSRPRSPYLTARHRRHRSAGTAPKVCSPKASPLSDARCLCVEERKAAAASLQGLRPSDLEAALLRALPGALEKLGLAPPERLPTCRGRPV